MVKQIEEAAGLLAARRKAVALTGAGISVESGIPPFRGREGLWEKYDPEEYAHIDAFRANPAKVWEMQAQFLEVIDRALPNDAHLALARLESMGILATVITQNVDGLHQLAGNTDVVEFHGNNRRLICLSCRRYFPVARAREQMPPLCDCGAVLKPDAVFFGEPIPRDALLRSHVAAQSCQVMLVIGTSAVVEPAASIPLVAKRAGVAIIEINPEPTGLTNSIADYFLQGKAGEILPRLVELVQAERGRDNI